MSTSCIPPVATKSAKFLAVPLADEAYALSVLSLPGLPRLISPEICEPVLAAA